MTSSPAAFDVFVLGGGPAGAATALALRRRGLAVALVEKRPEPLARVGESLSAQARRPLQALGVWDAFLADGHAPGVGQRSVWGGPEPREAHGLHDPDGHGWHLDRRRFEALLLREAARAGACLRAGESAVALSFDGARWRVRTSAGAAFEARLAVDAGGRAAPLARLAGARRVAVDRLVAVSAFVPPASGQGFDGFTLVEAVSDGWWYSAPLPDRRRVLAFFTDADLAVLRPSPVGARGQAAFLDLLARAPATAARLGGARRVRRLRFDSAPRLSAAGTSRLSAVAGGGWLAVGDAAAAFDPLSSQGIETALRWSLDAACAAERHLGGDALALRAYAAGVTQAYRRYLYERARVYEQEARWPEAPFWKRRQVHRPVVELRSSAVPALSQAVAS